MLYEPGMSCQLYVCVNLVHYVMVCWQINDDDDDDDDDMTAAYFNLSMRYRVQ